MILNAKCAALKKFKTFNNSIIKTNMRNASWSKNSCELALYWRLFVRVRLMSLMTIVQPI
jgi:hypothetical protein